MDLPETRRSCSSSGASVPVTCGGALSSGRRGPSPHRARRAACCGPRPPAAGTARRRRTTRSPSRRSPAAIARSGPTTSAVVTRTCARSAIIAAVGGGDTGAAEVADRRRPVWPHDDPVAVELPVRDPELMELRRCSPDPLHQRRRRSSSALREPRGRPVISLTNSASRWFAMPAATIGRTGTPARSASKVTNASCSTCCSRPNPRLGRSPRRQSEDQIDARNWPSHASRPYTLSRSA